MPFSEPFDQIFKYQIRPMLGGLNFPLAASRADTIMRTGYVMCEKICRQIQEADLIVAEITQAKQNVLYELGLAAGLRRRILLMTQDGEGNHISSDARHILSKLNISDDRHNRKCFRYVPFTYIRTTADELLNNTWRPSSTSDRNRQTLAKVGVLTSGQLVNFDLSYRPTDAAFSQAPNHPLASLDACLLEDVLKCILGSVNRDIILEHEELETEDDHQRKLQTSGNPTQEVEKKPSELQGRQSRENILRQQYELIEANQAPGNVPENRFDPEIRWMVIDSRRTDSHTTSFEELARFVEDCECIVVDASAKADPINFFWLGYSHAKGKNVIPVTVHEATLGTPSVELPFDVRGLWHVYLEIQRPENLKAQFKGIMQKIIIDDIEKRAKRAFWEPFLHDVEIQILVGANLKRAPDRYMVGEWDYMTLAELVGFLSQEKPTLDIQIASPVYQKRRGVMEELVKHSCDGKSEGDKDLDDYLKEMIGGKNCILIASPDVNIVTEMALAKAKNVCPFRSKILNDEGGFTGFVGYKSKSVSNENESDTQKRADNRRGFVHWRHMIFKEFSSQYTFIPADSSAQDTAGASPEDNEDANYTFYNYVAEEKKKNLERNRNNEQLLISERPISEREISQSDEHNTGRYEGLYGYMAIFKNPYTPEKRVLVLSGISGPATMAMAQILTGCVNSDVTVNGLLSSSNQDEYEKGKTLLKDLLGLNKIEEKNEAFYGLLKNRIKMKDETQTDEKNNKDPFQEGASLEDWSKAIEKIIGDEDTSKEDASKDKILVKGTSKKTESLELDYSLFSEKLLIELNKKIDDSKGNNVEALFYVVIGHSSKSSGKKSQSGGKKSLELEWKDPRRILLWGFANCAAEDLTLDNPKEFVTNIRDIHSEYQWPSRERAKELGATKSTNETYA